MADLKLAIGTQNRAWLTVGSMSPWIEAILPGGVAVTDLKRIAIESPAIGYVAPEFAYAGKFDGIVAYSSVEHFGLGRYGDDLDPEADKKFMRQVRDCISPGGKMFLAVPVSPVGLVESCFHRIYGPEQLAALLDGWKIVAITRNGQPFTEVPFAKPAGWADWQNQPLFTLEPA